MSATAPQQSATEHATAAGAQLRDDALSTWNAWLSATTPELVGELGTRRRWHIGKREHRPGCEWVATHDRVEVHSEAEALLRGRTGLCCISWRMRQVRDKDPSPLESIRDIWSVGELLGTLRPEPHESSAGDRPTQVPVWNAIAAQIRSSESRSSESRSGGGRGADQNEQLSQLRARMHAAIRHAAEAELKSSGPLTTRLLTSGASPAMLRALKSALAGNSPRTQLALRPRRGRTQMLSVILVRSLGEILVGDELVEFVALAPELAVAGAHRGEHIILERPVRGDEREHQELTLALELLGNEHASGSSVAFQELYHHPERVEAALRAAAAAVR